jgi:PAS domain S-box-containing protein
MRLLIASVKDYAIFMLDTHGRIASWNPGAEAIKGYRIEEILGRELSVFYTPEDRAAGKPARLLGQAFADGRVEDEGWRVRKDGTRFWADVVISAMRDEQGALVGYTKVTRDMTDRKRAEAEIARRAVLEAEERQRAARAEAAVRERDVFLSVAAHELRTPLAVLQLKLEGLERIIGRDLHGSPIAAKVADALRQTERLSELVERLLDVSRIAAGELDVHPERVELQPIIAEVSEALRNRSEPPSIEVFTYGDCSGDWDRRRLEQVLTNLLSNAIKYGEGRPVQVVVEDHGAEVQLRVVDSGIGIAEHDLLRIFEPFERAAPIESYPGLGLGLYVTRRIVEAHGGVIRASSQLGHGTTFTITLPRNAAPAMQDSILGEQRP